MHTCYIKITTESLRSASFHLSSHGELGIGLHFFRAITEYLFKAIRKSWIKSTRKFYFESCIKDGPSSNVFLLLPCIHTYKSSHLKKYIYIFSLLLLKWYFGMIIMILFNILFRWNCTFPFRSYSIPQGSS